MVLLESLSLRQARRIALAAQGFADAKPKGAVDRRHLRKVMARTSLLQIDSVNVLSRAHYLPVFSRIGAYDQKVLDSMVHPHREHYEYWAHEASIVPVSLYPALHWRTVRAHEKFETWGRPARLAQEHPGYIEDVLAEVVAHGPLRVSDLSMGTPGKGSWWGWSDAKVAVEWLFWIGEITAHSRGSGFERIYDIPSRVLPAEVLARPMLSEEDGQRELMRAAARAHGVATESDLRDYFRLRPEPSKARVAELVESGELIPVAVEGWKQSAYLWHEAVIPRRAINARALLVPFDPLVFERSRTERLFGMRYRIEIYTPEPKREYGYYVLPFLLGEELVARVDLKADRKAGVLIAQSAHLDSALPPGEIAEPLVQTLREMAAWLGLSGVVATGKGELGPALADTL